MFREPCCFYAEEQEKPAAHSRDTPSASAKCTECTNVHHVIAVPSNSDKRILRHQPEPEPHIAIDSRYLVCILHSMSNITIKEIAEKCGLAQSSVRNILSSGGWYSEKTKKKVYDVARAHGYVPSRLPAALRQRRAASVGILLRRLRDSHDLEVLDWLLCLLAKDDVDTMVDTAEWRTRKEALRRFKAFTGWGFRALILSSFAEIKREDLLAIRKSMFVVTMRQFPWPDFSCVTQEPGMRETLAVNHLLQLGHRKIGILGFDLERTDTGRKTEILNDELAKHGLSVAPEHKYTVDHLFPQRITDEGPIAREVIEIGKRLAQTPPARRPSAIMAFYDVNASWLISGFMAAGGRIPEDLSVMSYNDTVISQSCVVPLTTVAISPKTIATEAIKLVKAGITSSSLEPMVKHVTLKPKLNKRGSTGPFSG